ncbi:MAG: hypothetical protein LBT43_13160, partial [Prevotella sp.]|nr:hypothetical protein [Prevotella sp.]
YCSDRCSMWGRSNAILQNIKKWPEEKSSDHDWVVVSLFFDLVATLIFNFGHTNKCPDSFNA